MVDKEIRTEYSCWVGHQQWKDVHKDRSFGGKEITARKAQVNGLNWGKADISLVVLISSFCKDGSLEGIEIYKTSMI